MAKTKPQYESLERLVEDRSPVWQERMGLAHYEIEHAFLDSYFGDDGEEDFKITATTESRWNYLTAKIKWYLPSAVRHNDERLEQVLVHEMCHVLLSPEQALLEDELELNASALSSDEQAIVSKLYYERLELATESVSRALWKAYEAA